MNDNSKHSYNFKLNKKSYIIGQAWCERKKQHVCLYFGILFSIGILGELYSLIMLEKYSQIWILSLISIVLYIITDIKIHSVSKKIYDLESKNWSVIVDDISLQLFDIDRNIKVSFDWNQMRNVYKYREIYIFFITKYDYIHFDEKVLENTKISDYVKVKRKII